MNNLELEVQRICREIYFSFHSQNPNLKVETEMQKKCIEYSSTLSSLFHNLKFRSDCGLNIQLKFEAVKLYCNLFIKKFDISKEILVKHYARTIFNMYNKCETKIKCILNGEDFFIEHFEQQLKVLNNMVLLAHTDTYFIPYNYQKSVRETIEDFKERLCKVVSEDLLFDMEIGQPIFQFNAYPSSINCSLNRSFYLNAAKLAKYLNVIIS